MRTATEPEDVFSALPAWSQQTVHAFEPGPDE